jgi:hypothetical protein
MEAVALDRRTELEIGRWAEWTRNALVCTPVGA